MESIYYNTVSLKQFPRKELYTATTTEETKTNEKEECLVVEPVTNTKCIVFTIFVVVVYWFLPRNKWILLFLIWFAYIMLAWYDHWYNCQRELGPAYLATFYSFIKPPESKQMKIYKNLCPETRQKVLMVDISILILFLIFFFGIWNPK